MPLNGKMGHVEKRSQKVVLDVPVLKMAVVPRPRAGTDNAAPRGLEAATATTAAELAAAATNAAPEIEKNTKNVSKLIRNISGSFLRRQLMIANYRVKKFVRKSQ